MGLTEELKGLLYQKGAKLVGVGSLEEITECNYSIGVSVAVLLPGKIIRDLQTAPTKEYYDMYYTLNHQLNDIVTLTLPQKNPKTKPNQNKTKNHPGKPG